MPTAPLAPVIRLELELTSGVWTDVWTDVAMVDGLQLRYGMAGGGPTDRVADVGWCRFSLRNGTNNTAQKLGWYSPLHANCRAGFTYGIGVRVSFTWLAVTYYKWRGTLQEIDPVPGQYRERVTRCLALDWMEEAAQAPVRDVEMQIAQRSDQVFSAVLGAIVRQPAATSIQQGIDTFAVALDDLGRRDHPKAARVFQSIAMSEQAFIYPKGDLVQGGTLVYENRHTRPLNNITNLTTLDNAMLELEAPRSLDGIFNCVEISTHPKRIDTGATVLASLDSVPAIAPGQTVTLWLDYTDPDQVGELIGGTGMIPLVATTDYILRTIPNSGEGDDLTASATVTATFWAGTVEVEVTNGAAREAYVQRLQCRGFGLYDESEELSMADDFASQALHGARHLHIDMPYQDDRNIGQGIADYLSTLYGGSMQRVDRVRFLASTSSALLMAALAREISDRVGITEAATGVSADAGGGLTRGWHINAVELEVQAGPVIWCTWTLAPGDAVVGWILGAAGYSELDTTAQLGAA